MNLIDTIITSKTFNLIPNIIKWIWSPVSKRQHFLRLREVYEIFGENDFQPYSDVYGRKAAVRRYFKITGAATSSTRC
jgi:hypothetical protein